MIAIIVVCWNHLNTTTAPCLDSIQRFTETPYRVICVDNASEDDTINFLKTRASQDPRVCCVFNSKNLGWADGVLKGLEHLTKEDEYVCLLNSDTIVTPGWLGKLLSCLKAHPGRTGVIPNEYPTLSSPLVQRIKRLYHRLEGLLFQRSRLDRILRVSKAVEKRYKGQDVPAAPSGFCLLTSANNLFNMREYLDKFEQYWSGQLDWRDYVGEIGGQCFMALDTYVYHARGGSGGYHRKQTL